MNPGKLHNEKEKLRRVAAGDEKAFEELFYEYREFLAAHIFRIVESREVMEEMVQDVFLKIWLTREVLPEVDNFKGYLVVVSRNQALNALDKLLREMKHKAEYIKGLSPDLEEDQGGYAGLKLSLLDQAIDALPTRQKEVYLLHRHSRLTYDEIAARMGIGRETVKSQLKAAVNFITVHVRDQISILITLFELWKH